MTFYIIGHRGMGAAPLENGRMRHGELPENTLLSFWVALKRGVEGVELDVHLSRDGVPMVIHSSELGEKIPHDINGGPVKGEVGDFTAHQLKSYALGRGQLIPTLQEALTLSVRFNAQMRGCKPRPIVNIELKKAETAGPTHRVVDAFLKSAQLDVGNIVFCSFKWDALEELRRANPLYRVAPMLKTERIFGADQVIEPDYRVKPGATVLPRLFVDIANQHKRMPFDAVDCVVQDIRPEIIDFCRKRGLGLFTSVSSYRPKIGPLDGVMEVLEDAASKLPFVAFKVDRPDRVVAMRRKGCPVIARPL